jgi:hypothetical protein
MAASVVNCKISRPARSAKSAARQRGGGIFGFEGEPEASAPSAT